MAIGDYGAVAHQIRRLFDVGTVAGMSEWQLLERFTTTRDEAAFEAIVARFGPMILGVCRRMLIDEADVEDAFQATFLVLVRKARTLGERDALGHWLYGVASRVALRARSEAARRRGRERLGPAVEHTAHEEDPGRFEIASVLDAELSRLPAKYRAPIVLCYFEGLTHEDAALRLGWPVGSVKGRLARARDLLRDRLTRRGLTLSAGALAATLSHEAAAAVPAALSASTIRAALQVAVGQAAAGVVSASVVGLFQGVVTSMFLTPWKITGAGMLVLGIGAGVLAYQATTPGKRNATPARGAQAQAQATATRAEADASEPSPTYQSVLKHLDENIAMQFPNETPLEDILKYIKAATTGPNDTGIPIYVDPAGLTEVNKTVTSPVNLDVEGVPLKTSLRQVLRPLGLDYRVRRNGILAISSRNATLDEEIQDLKEELSKVNAQLKTVGRIHAPLPASTKAREAPAKGAVDTRPKDLLDKFQKLTPLALTASFEDAKTKSIHEKLDEPISMSFAKETPLEDVLKYIKSATQGPNDTGIPIYVDPIGLNEAEETMISPVTLDLEGVPLKITLRLVLKQLGLTYLVKDGLLLITSEDSEARPIPILQLVERAQRGELTLDEIRGLTELIKALDELDEVKQERFKGGQFQ